MGMRGLRHLLRSVRGAYFTYALGLVVLIAVTTGWIVYGNYRSHRDVNDRLLSSLAGVALSQAEGSVRAIDLLLDEAAQMIAANQWPTEKVASHLQARLAGFPEVRDLIVVDASGRTVAPIVSATGVRHVTLDLHDREFFQYQRDHWQENRLYISRPVVSRALNETIIPLSRPLRSRDGTFKGLVGMSLSAGHLDRLMASVVSTQGISAALLRSDGPFLARHPDGSTFRDHNANMLHVFSTDQLQHTPNGVLHLSAAPLAGLPDGLTDRLVAFQSSGTYPLVAAVAEPSRQAFEEWRASATRSVAVVVLLSVSVLALALIVERQDTALRHSAAIIESSDDAIVGKSLDGTITSWNRGAERLFGYSPNDIIGKPIQILFPDASTAEEQRILSRIMAGETIAPFETVRRRRNGTLVDILVQVSPIRDRHGRIIGASSIAYDITARKRAEEALRLSESRLSQFFHISPAAISVSSMGDGRFRVINDTFLSVFGFDRAELIGQSAVDKAIWVDIDDRVDVLAALRREGRVQNRDIKLRRKSGEIGEFLYSAAAITLDGEDCVLSMILDVTEYRQTNRRMAELRQSNSELEQFAYVASHDLREPLRMVTSYLKLLKQHLGDKLDTEAGEFIHFAVDGAMRMDALIHDLLEYSRVGNEALREPVDLNEIMTEARTNLAIAIGERSATVTIADGLPTVTGDRYELMRLFQNLIGNALKYRHPERPPAITVDWRDGGREAWVVTVRDNGTGIDERNFDRIFGIFQRLVSRNAIEGTGIGLAICRKIVDQHGGRIWLESTVGEGTTFLISLPKMEAAP